MPTWKRKWRPLAEPRPMRRREPRLRAASSWPVASTGSWATPMVRANTLVDPPGSTARPVSLPASPLAASLRVPSPPSTTTASAPALAASWARRAALPRRVVSATLTSWSAERALRITTRARAVTADADVLTIRSRRKGLPLLFCGPPELGQAAGQQPGHVHLADAEAPGDLRLGEPLEEAQVEDGLFPPRELGDEGGERDPVLDALEGGVVLPQLAGQGLGVLLAAAGGVEGGEPVGPPGLHGLEHLLLRGAGPLGHLCDGGRAPQVLGEHAHDLAETQVQLLDAAGHPDRPPLVPEVALELAHDGGGGV